MIQSKTLSLLRRRLISALRYIKLYAERIRGEYVGEHIEMHVRPSDPLKGGSYAAEIDSSLKISGAALAMPAFWRENIWADVGAKASNPFSANFNWEVYSLLSSTNPVNKVDFVKPTGFNFQTAAEVGFEARLDFAKTIGVIGAFSTATVHTETPFSFIEMPCLYMEVDGEGCDLTFAYQFIKPLSFNAIVNDFNAALSMQCSQIRLPSLKAGYEIVAGLTVTAIRDYVAATLAKLSTLSLTDVSEMPLNTNYVLVTYDDEYPWETQG